MPRFIVLTCVQLIILFFLTPISSTAQSLKTVLLIHSYHVGYKWTDDITTAISKDLNRLHGIDLRVEYLDTKRYYSPAFLQFQSGVFLEKYQNETFDVIVVSDNNALSFVLTHREKLFSDIPIVFCGINYFKKEVLQGHSNITGVNEAPDFKNTIEFMLSNHPDTKRIVTIVDDSVTGKLVNDELLEVSKSYPDVEWITPENRTFDGWLEYLENLKINDLVMLGLFTRDSTGEYFEYDEVSTKISSNSPVPVYALWDFYLDYGIVGGYLASAIYQGEVASDLVHKILEGTPADDLPVVMKSPNRYLADFNAMKKFGISGKQFPPETIVYNQPPDFYEENKVSIWTFFGLFTVLCFLSLFLSIILIRKKKVEEALLSLKDNLEHRVKSRTNELSVANKEITEREQQMQNLLANLSSMIYRRKNDTSWTMLFVSQGSVELTGYSERELKDNGAVSYADLIDERDQDLVTEAINEAIANNSQFSIEYRIHTKDKSTKWVWEQGIVTFDDDGQVLYLDGKILDISKRKEIEQEQKKLVTVVEQTDELVLITSLSGEIEYVNPAFERITGYGSKEIIGKNPRMLKSGKQPFGFYESMWKELLDGEIWHGQLINLCKDGSEYVADVSIFPIQDQQGELINYVGVQRDITQELALENRLRQAQRLEAIGTLAGGIAHEINTPAHFVGTNIEFLKEANEDVFKLINSYQQLLETARTNQLFSSDVRKIMELQEDIDLEYFRDEIPTAIDQSQEGIKRITKIVLAMKEFSHPSSKDKTGNNLNKLIETAVTVASNEWKHLATMQLDLDPDLPTVNCYADKMSQVFLNVIVNAAHAIAGKESEKDKESIKITSVHNDQWVEVRITDSGSGIPAEAQNHIFDPFFTTKEVGKGTGQGLSIAYDIVTVKHDGELSFETTENEGTTFIVKIPSTK